MGSAAALRWMLLPLIVGGALGLKGPMGPRVAPSPSHTLAGLPIRGAGVVPYVNLPGRGVHFLLQTIQNGTRYAGKVCDFGGRRELSDIDTFATAAREFCEETGFVFGNEHDIAEDLRTSAMGADPQVRILNRKGQYAVFFHKVPYVPAGMLPEVDCSPEGDRIARECRWWRADQLINQVDNSAIVERLFTRPPSDSQPAKKRAGGAAAEEEPAWGAARAERPLSSFERALFKTVAIENAHPFTEERWHATVLDSIAGSKKRRSFDKEEDVELALNVARVAGGGGRGATRPKAAKVGKGGHAGSVKPSAAGAKTSVGGTKRRAHAGGKGVVEKRTPNDSGVRRPSRGEVSGGDATLAPKRGSRRGPPKPSNIARRNWATTVADPAAQPALVSRVAHAKAARTRGGPTWPDEVYDEFLP